MAGVEAPPHSLIGDGPTAPLSPESERCQRPQSPAAATVLL